jgi:voltage-gated potassium channel
VKADALSEFKKRLRLSFVLFVAVLAGGTGGYWLVAGDRHSFLDYFYMTVITVATVGYGEIVDLSGNPAGRAFTIVLIFAGMSVILYFMSNITAFLIEGHATEIFWRRKMQKFVSSLDGHYIVCGAGRIGVHILEDLTATKRPTVVIDSDHAKMEALKERFPGAGLIEGDASESDTLLMAGIARAGGLVVATGNDKDNLVITLTARQLAPSLRIVARCNDTKNSEKLRLAGADSVVSSSYIGGLRMVSEMVRPTVVSFLDRMLRDTEKNLRIEELEIPPGAPIAGKTADSVKKCALLLAVRRKDGSFAYNPEDALVLEEGLSLIFMGSPEDRAKLERLIRP